MLRFLIKGKKFARAEQGNSTVEFTLLFPAFILLFLTVVETGVFMTRGVMLDRALDIAIRDLRLGTLSPMSHEGLKTRLCENAVIIPNCENSVRINLRSAEKKNWTPVSKQSGQCVDRSEPIQPVVEFQQGVANELMLVSACAVFDPFFPTTGLAAQMKLDNTGAYGLITRSAYVNEP